MIELSKSVKTEKLWLVRIIASLELFYLPSNSWLYLIPELAKIALIILQLVLNYFDGVILSVLEHLDLLNNTFYLLSDLLFKLNAIFLWNLYYLSQFCKMLFKWNNFTFNSSFDHFSEFSPQIFYLFVKLLVELVLRDAWSVVFLLVSKFILWAFILYLYRISSSLDIESAYLRPSLLFWSRTLWRFTTLGPSKVLLQFSKNSLLISLNFALEFCNH